MKAKKKSEIGVLEKVAYGSGDLASNLILVLSSTFVTFFYTDALGLNPGIIGTIMLVSRFLDGTSDIIMGFIMDKTRSKRGRARAWIYWLAIPIAIATVLIFCVPNTGDFGKYVYVAITYNLVTTILYTAINIPYGAFNSMMTRDQDERMVINVFRMTMAQIGSLAINAMTLPVVNALGGSSHQSSWIIISVIYGVAAMLLFYFCYSQTKERVQIAKNVKKAEKMSFVESFKICIKNDQWLLLVLVWVVMSLGLGTGMTVVPYYAKYILENENLSGLLTAAQIAPIILSLPILPFIVRKIGKRNLAVCGAFISCVAQFMMFVNSTSFGWLVMCQICKGLGQGCCSGTIFAMVADTIEYGQWKTGVRTEGMLYSSTTFGAKIGAGVGSAAAMGLLGAVGYNGLLAVQNAEVLSLLKVLYIAAPAICVGLVGIVFLFYKLDKIYPKVIEELQEREV